MLITLPTGDKQCPEDVLNLLADLNLCMITNELHRCTTFTYVVKKGVDELLL